MIGNEDYEPRLEDEERIDAEGREELSLHPGSRAWLFKLQGFDWNELAGRTEKAPKKTVALVIGYNGGRYKGLQQVADQTKSMDDPNKFLPTVESELELALLQAGALIPSNFGNLKKLHWTRVGRTDAGVSAVCNVVTAKLIVGDGGADEVQGLIARVNRFLPPDVKLHSAAVVPRRFNARWDGSARSYVYLMPSYCAARSTPGALRAALAARGWDARDLGPEESLALEADAGLRALRLRAGELELFRQALACFRGTQYFANFTKANIDRTAPQAWRHVREVSCGEPFLGTDGHEWLPITIAADSFLTHQIRKMVATAAQVAQGFLPLDFVHAALSPRICCKSPKFPPFGLIFLRPFFKHKERGLIVEDSLESLIESHCTTEWQEELQRSIMEADSESCTWVRWLARTLQYEEHMRGQAKRAVSEYKLIRQTHASRIAQRQAAAAQVAAILSGTGAPLWVGRHKWVGKV